MRHIRNVGTGGVGHEADARAVLRALGIDPSEGNLLCVMGNWRWSGDFDVDDPRWRRLVEWERKQIGREPWVVHRIEYSSAELAAAEMLEIGLKTEPRGDIGPSQGTRYDLSEACPACHSGATVIPPFYIEARVLPKKRCVAATHQNVKLVSGALLDELASRHHSSAWLVPVADSRGRKPVPWAAILPRVTLPRLERSSKGFLRDTNVGPKSWGPCPKCERDMWHTTSKEAFEPVLSRRKIAEACGAFMVPGQMYPDVAASWERAWAGVRPNGLDNVSVPFIFVNQAVYQILCKHAKKYLRATPVTMVE